MAVLHYWFALAASCRVRRWSVVSAHSCRSMFLFEHRTTFSWYDITVAFAFLYSIHFTTEFNIPKPFKISERGIWSECGLVALSHEMQQEFRIESRKSSICPTVRILSHLSLNAAGAAFSKVTHHTSLKSRRGLKGRMQTVVCVFLIKVAECNPPAPPPPSSSPVASAATCSVWYF